LRTAYTVTEGVAALLARLTPLQPAPPTGADRL
jgi:hypothetical protein